MRKDADRRVAVWAITGFLVAILWGIYFADSNKDSSVQPIVYAIARLSQPGVGPGTLLYPHVPLELCLNLIANGATYAVVGMVVEVTRKRFNERKIRVRHLNLSAPTVSTDRNSTV